MCLLPVQQNIHGKNLNIQTPLWDLRFPQQWETRLWSSGLWYYVHLQVVTNVLGKHATSIFKVPQTKRSTSEISARFRTTYMSHCARQVFSGLLQQTQEIKLLDFILIKAWWSTTNMLFNIRKSAVTVVTNYLRSASLSIFQTEKKKNQIFFVNAMCICPPATKLLRACIHDFVVYLVGTLISELFLSH
jgi:hypothetical protein